MIEGMEEGEVGTDLDLQKLVSRGGAFADADRWV